MKDADFVKAFDNVVASKKDKDSRDVAEEREDYFNKVRKKGYFLGVSKIVVVNPNYLKVTQSAKISV